MAATANDGTGPATEFKVTDSTPVTCGTAIPVYDGTGTVDVGMGLMENGGAGNGAKV